MKKPTRILSAALASIMLASSFCAFSGCSATKKQPKAEFISEDQPWFDSTKIDIECPYDKSEFEYMFFSEPAYVDGYIYALFQGYKFINTKEAENPDFDYDSTMIKSVFQYDLEGNFVKEISLTNGQYRVGYCSGIEASGDKLKVACEAYDKDEGGYLTTQLILDPKTESFDKEIVNIDIDPIETIQAEYQVGDKKVYLIANYESMRFRFVICGDENKNISINNAVEDLQYLEDCIVIDNNTLLGFCDAKGPQTIELNVETGEITKSDIDINLNKYRFTAVQDGKAYSVNSEGVFTINDNFEIESVMDFDDTLVNLYDLNSATPLYVDNDLIVISSSTFDGGTQNFHVYTFKPASSNPNAGKKIIDVFSMIPYISYAESEAIIKFNQTNSEYFATLRFADYGYSGDPLENNKAVALASDQLIIDIMAGDGPDILLNGFDFSEFNNPDYFIDLNTLIAEDKAFDKSKYFDNIIEASQNYDGALYQIPASFTIDCIAAKVSDVGEGHIGFTYDDYDRFLDEACNGVSPIKGTRTEYLDLCITAGYFDYLKDGKVDFNNEGFKQACDFATSHFAEDAPFDDHMMYISTGVGCLTEPTRTDFFDPGVLIWQFGGTPETVGFYGFPSSTEHGPTAYISSSAAISAEANDKTKDACWNLIKIMLDDEVQTNLKSSFPMNKAALSNMLVTMADEADSHYNTYINMGYSEAEIAMFNEHQVNRSIVDSFYEAITNVTDVARSDSSLEIIIAEELPAYFAGQKDIDSVIGIINDRAQTIYDERSGK